MGIPILDHKLREEIDSDMADFRHEWMSELAEESRAEAEEAAEEAERNKSEEKPI